MPLPVYRLRRLLGVTALVVCALVAGMYFYARSRARNVLKEIPNKIGYDVKQTANGFQFSKSDGKRTLFTIQASDVKEFKLNGRAELHKVSIVLYGRDSSRYDQIYGDDFAYDPRTGDATAQGDVQIDLVANPSGLASPDQSAPKELKTPIHLKTRDLVFNRNTGNASTDARVEFSTPQADGWAVGVQYAGKSNVLTLSSQIHVAISGANAAMIEAQRGTITNEPREVVLEQVHLDRQGAMLRADRAVFRLGSDNSVQNVLATGNVTTESRVARPSASPQAKATETHAHANQAEFFLAEKKNLLRSAILSGDVHVEQTGAQPIEGNAGRVILEFAGRNQLQRVRAVDGARLTQRADGGQKTGPNSSSQSFDLTAPVINFVVAKSRTLDRAETEGAARITITGAQPGSSASNQQTVVAAGQFEAKFAAEQDGVGGRQTHLSFVRGAPDARIVNSAPGQPDRISSSDSVEATFFPQGGIEGLTQQGKVAYSDQQPPGKQVQAWANSAQYTPADQMLVLTGSPRVSNGAMTTTANTIRINRATGSAQADGDVKSTYSDLKEQPDGALLASASPIHVTARSMTTSSSPGVATYFGNARLWQDGNIIEAPTIQFDRDRRFVTATGTAAQPVQTILVQAEKAGGQKTTQLKDKPAGGTSPVAITSAKITYEDSERRVHYEGGVQVKGADFSATAQTLDAYLLRRRQLGGQGSMNQASSGPGQLDRMVAQGNIVIQEPNRRAEGQKLVYTPTDDKFVLTGGPPSIFDAEHGKITGVSLTFYRRDDRVLVEGEAGSPVVTQTRVAR